MQWLRLPAAALALAGRHGTLVASAETVGASSLRETLNKTVY
jgi:hypothetical protein